MTNKERLMAALFADPAREHVDIKFFVLGGFDLSPDKLCGEAADMLEQMEAAEGDIEFAEAFQQREVSDFVATV